MAEEHGYRIQALERAFRILQCFKSERQLGITEISRLVGLSKSTTFGLADTMVSLGLLSRNAETNKYELGTEIFLLSLCANRDLRSVVQPYLRRLVDEFGETANLVMHDGTHSIYADKLESPHAMRICTSIGQRIPFYASAAGRSILAFLSETERRTVISSFDFSPYTENTVSTPEALSLQLEQIRQSGFCVEREEFEPGIFCVAVPVFSGPDRRPIAAISVSGPISRFSDEIRTRIVARLTEYSPEISALLGSAERRS